MKEGELIACFSDRQIALCLAGLRAKQCVKRHDARVLDRYFLPETKAKKTDVTPADEVVRRHDDPGWYMPPRALWSRLRLAERMREDATRHARLAIMRHVDWVLSNGRLDDFAWGRRFRDFAERVRARVATGDFSFARPVSFAIEQPGKSPRFVTSFEDLEDKVIIGLTAKYLRRKLDAALSPNCYSFRQDGSVDHLTAVRALVDYRKMHAGEDLWVAECDIRKFFDTIDHRVALKAFDRLAKGKGVDPCARAILVGYLKAYTVRTTLVKGAKPQSRAKCRAYVDKVREALATVGVRPSARVGIPQGGALSGLLANWVLSVADRAVARKLGDGFYARYCDDIVIAAPDKHACRLARDRYLRAMKRLRLPVHAVRNNLAYGPKYYKEKSKGPYRWLHAAPGTTVPRGCAPWVSFLGSQVNADGEVRVREQSISNHMDSLKAERNRALWLVHNRTLRKKMTVHGVAKALAARIVCKGVGYLRAGPFAVGSGTMSWMSAFETVDGKAARRQLRDLDAWRQRLLHPLVKGARSYFGRPASYCGYYEKVARPGYRKGKSGVKLHLPRRPGYSAL